jgi:tricorn protease
MRITTPLIALAVLLGLVRTASAIEVKLAKHPDYCQGKIVFSYLGDLWLVNEDGSGPRRLTVHRARDVYPRFSPDGKWIAFSSNRNGNYAVFLMPAEGGKARQLTYHGADDTVVGWSPDAKKVVFSSSRGRVYPGIPSLYEVPQGGGLETALPVDWGSWGSFNADGTRLAFNRHPLPWWRKYYRGSYAADLWVLDLPSHKFKRLVDDELPDDQKPNNYWPLFADGFIYFVSDRNVMARAGSPKLRAAVRNIWKIPEEGGSPLQVTFHESGALYYPSLAADRKTIVYEQDFGIWKLDLGGGQTRPVKINIAADDAENNVETVTVNGELDSYSLSPSGKRAVISTHGELFTIPTDKGEVRRLTQTPKVREVSPQWSPDGKRIAFISDQKDGEQVWVCDEFGLHQQQISKGDSEKGQLAWSPDGQSLLYTASDNKLYRYSFTAGTTSVVLHHPGGPVRAPQWSPDGKWIAYSHDDETFLSHCYVIPAGGGKEQRITSDDTFTDSNPLWTADGTKIVYLARQDLPSMISGVGRRSTSQIAVVSLMPEEKDPSDRGIDSEEDAVRSEKDRPRFPKADKMPAKLDKVDVKIDFGTIGRRARQVTQAADTITAMTLTPDGKSALFVTAGVEGGGRVQSIWLASLDGGAARRVAQASLPADAEGPPRRGGAFASGLGSLQVSKDGRSLFYRQGKSLYTVSLGGGGPSEGPAAPTLPGRAGGRTGAGLAAPGAAGAVAEGRKIGFSARVDIDHRARRHQVFLESWRVMKHKFYDAGLHGADWNRVRALYEPLLDHVADQDELHNVVNMMLGELNASHTGISPGGQPGRAQAQARFPGFELATDAKGFFKVAHIYKNGPADKDYVKLSVGDYVLALGEHDLKAGANYWKHLAQAAPGRLTFLVNSKPDKTDAWTVKIQPVSATAQGNLQYEKWVAERQATVERLGGGRIGYLHIRAMSEPNLRQFERDLARLHNKGGLIIDQRFNPGGNIDQELLQILQQKQYQKTRSRGSIEATRPLTAFFGPMVVLANERSTSDAEVFPDGFRTLKLGKIVGVTTYGAVIGTGAYTLMDGSVIRTPSSGLWNLSGTNLENYGVPPDVYVDNTPEDWLRGRDAQLEKAVELLQGRQARQK